MSRTPLAASSSTWCSANGRPATGSSAFGRVGGVRQHAGAEAAGEDEDLHGSRQPRS